MIPTALVSSLRSMIPADARFQIQLYYPCSMASARRRDGHDEQSLWRKSITASKTADFRIPWHGLELPKTVNVLRTRQGVELQRSTRQGFARYGHGPR